MSFIVPAIFPWCQLAICAIFLWCHLSLLSVPDAERLPSLWCRQFVAVLQNLRKRKVSSSEFCIFLSLGSEATASFGATIIVLEFAKTPTEVKSARKNLPSVHPSMTWWHPRNLPSGSLTYHFDCLNTWKLELELGCQIVYFQAVTVKLEVEGCEAET